MPTPLLFPSLFSTPLWIRRLFFSSILAALACGCDTRPANSGWPAITRDHKPWTRWWWHGSAVTKEGITAELEAYSAAGLGGVEITPIYGVHGHEQQFVPFLSKEWMELLIHTLREAERLNMGVDMATGTGWPFGGPWVSEADASKNIYNKMYSLKGGQKLKDKVVFVQPPFLRAVGSQVYEVHDSFGGEPVRPEGTRMEPLMKYDPKNIRIEDIRQPVASNPDLQSLALDQVQFEKVLPLVALVAYGKNGEVVDLTAKVTTTGDLDWVAPAGEWQLYATFQGQHGKMVERAGPGGEGNVIDHFSRTALDNYLAKFDSAFSGSDISSLRAFFNDSYEVDDARGAADWTPALLDEFKRRRGYSLLDHLPALFGNDTPDLNARILYDYRLTISELLLDNFTQPWAEWAHGKKKIVRNQAHGAPANILDLYAAIDIPETEGVEPMRFKMATSAGHVTGKKLISSESATWLNEHFLSDLGDIKSSVDSYLSYGVNHIFYHGTSYSPPGEPWPGWLFYAAVHLNPRNPQWKDFAALNRYIARCQTFLQQGVPDNDVLLYYPIADPLSTRGPEMVEHFDSPANNFEESPSLTEAASAMLLYDFTFDYISDKQLPEVTATADGITTSGGGQYKAIVVPRCKYLPLETLSKFASLARDGAKILFVDDYPETVAGFGTERLQQFNILKEELKIIALPPAGIIDLVFSAKLRHEVLTQRGLAFVRRKLEGGKTVYFINNFLDKTFNERVPLQATAKFAVIRDPMTGAIGKANTIPGERKLFHLRLEPGQSLIIELTNEEPNFNYFPMQYDEGAATLLENWQLEFLDGGPELPKPAKLDSVIAWTSLPDHATQIFSGTASYSTTFKSSGETGDWMLDFGDIQNSATVILNGDSLATLIAPPFRVIIEEQLLNEDNKLEVRVSNLMANRISDLDKRGIQWKKFYNVNFPARKPENRVDGLFNSAGWSPLPSGMQGPVTLRPVIALQPSPGN
jgi:hypothetical protein